MGTMTDQCIGGVKRTGDEIVGTPLDLGCLCGQVDKKCHKKLRAEYALQNDDGQTCLHLLCQNPCCSVDGIRSLVEANPAASRKKDVYGRSPLLYALKRVCSVEVVKLLFDSYPDAILEKDICGDLPLYMLYHSDKHYRILEYVLSQQPSLALYKENCFSGQPLVKRICAPWTSKQLEVARSQVEKDKTLKDRWKKLVITIRAARAHFTGQEQSQNGSLELHAALEYACPPSIVCHFVEMYPDQASRLMPNQKCFPLHYFLFHYGAVQGTESVVKKLVDVFPGALSAVYKERFPTQIALSAGLTWKTGLRVLIFSDPNFLVYKDSASGLIPFMHAATVDRCDISTVYSLLRENPSVIRNLH